MTSAGIRFGVKSAVLGAAVPIARGATLVVLTLAAASCRSGATSSQLSVGSTQDAGGSTQDGGARQDAGAAISAPIDGLGTVYPLDAPPHPLAIRLCEALHDIPARRKAECCGGEPVPFLAKECARVLGATLHAKTVTLEEAAVERCATTMSDSLAGCDWVTPSPPPAPEACQGLLHGKLERGSVCRSSLECRGDMHCAGVSPTKTGVCTPPGAEGAGCGTHVDVLATYLSDRHLETSHPFCAEHCSLVAHKCGPVPLAGSPCVANVGCAPSQICASGRCSAAAPGGPGEPCGAVPCAEGLRCIDKVCSPPANSGAKCTASLDALRGRDGGLTMRLPMMPGGENSKR